MTVSGTRDERIFAIAAAQRGRVARRQLVDAGISETTVSRLARSGWLRRQHSGVFAVGPDVPMPLGDETAALLAVRAGAALSHHTAAVILKLRGPESGDALVHVTVPGASVEDLDGVRIHRSRVLSRRDLLVREGLLVTAPARVLLDLAPVISERELERALDQMVIERVGTLRQVAELLTRCGRHAGRGPVQDMLDAYAATTFTRSEAEELFLALMRDAGLPQPLVNAKRHGYQIDFYWPREHVAVEVDGFAFHSSRAAFERDRLKDQHLRRAGITIIRVTWRQLQERPAAVIADVAQALARTAR
jgi:very-short-patch-repair endonuclease